MPGTTGVAGFHRTRQLTSHASRAKSLPMPRFYLPADLWEVAVLGGEESHHLSQVMRVKPGETITLFDGAGNEAPAIVLSSSKSQTHLRIGSVSSALFPLPQITLAQAIPKGKNMDWIVQKAVELGVWKIHPLVTRHTIVQPGGEKAEKWRRTALEACKQCGQNFLPEIAEPMPMDAWLKQQEGDELKLLASLAKGAKNFREILAAHPAVESVTIVIGPEGDFSEGETEAALEAGFIPVTLGHLVLRVETATMLCLSSIRYQFM